MPFAAQSLENGSGEAAQWLGPDPHPPRPRVPSPARGVAGSWDGAGASRSDCLLLGLCSAPPPGATTHNPIADQLHLKSFWAWIGNGAMLEIQPGDGMQQRTP